MPNDPAPTSTRKSVNLQDDMWQSIADYRFSRRLSSEAEAIRLLLKAGLEAEAGEGAAPQ